MGKYFWILAGLAIIAVVYFWGGKWAGQYTGVETTTSPSPVAETTAKPVKKGATTAPTKSYSDAVKEYEGRRIQFDERCQVVPQSPTYKNGTSVMLDNRSASARTVMVGGTKYDLSAFGYKVITLSGSGLPKELAVSCGSSGNVGRILLQAQILQ